MMRLRSCTTLAFALVLFAGAVEAANFRCGPSKYLRLGDTAKTIAKACGQPLIVWDGLDNRGRAIQFWRYLQDPDGPRSGGVLQLSANKMIGWRLNEITWMKCRSNRAVIGDNRGAVTAKCRAPAHVQELTGSRGEKYEEWFYLQRGSKRDTLMVFTFMKDTLIAMETRAGGRR